MSVVDMVLHHARLTPHKQAIILSDRLVSYEMLAGGILSAEAAIAAAGLTREDVVAVIIGNRIRRLIVTLALYRAGITSIPLAAPNDTVAPTVTLIDDPDAVVPGRRIEVGDDWFARAPLDQSPAGFGSEDDAAIVVLSSGTTAGQKPIVWTPRILDSRIDLARRNLAIAPWDRMLCLPPIVSAYGLLHALIALYHGHTLLFSDRPLDVLQMIALYNVDFVVANPVYLQELVAVHREAPIPTGSIKLVLYGGTSIDPRRLPEIRARICPNLFCQYSSTETGVIALGLNETPVGDEVATGYVAPWVTVEVVGPTGDVKGPGEIGRLRIRSPWQATGWKTAEKGDGWLTPGDIGRISPEGLLTLVGRDSEALVIDGEYVTAEQVELELTRVPGVSDAAVVTVAGPEGEPAFQAAFAGDVDVDATALNRFLAKRNERFRVTSATRVETIPRNAMGKIDRRQVRATLAG